MKQSTLFTCALLVAFGASACAAAPTPGPSSDASPTAPASLPVLAVDPSARFQTIDGFGTSGCWWAQDVGTWGDERVEEVADLLFDPEKGIGLTLYRFEAGAGGVNGSTDPWRSAETFEVSPGTYDWSRDPGGTTMLRAAVARGVDGVVLMANSPPGRMTVNGRTDGGDGGGSNLQPGMEADFARYLVDIAAHFKDEGIPVRWISPINEPQWDWQPSKNQEGCHYEPGQILTVARALVTELSGRLADVRPSLIESGQWLDAKYTVPLYRMLGKDPLVGPAMDHYAIHSYWSSDFQKTQVAGQLAATGLTIPVWQTEWCEMKSGRDDGMASALVLARCVHEDLAEASCSAWMSWIAVSCYDYKDGLLYADRADRSVQETKKLWALGNFSRFIGEGSVRVGLDYGEGTLLPSAFLSADGKRLVVVVVNPSLGSFEVDVRVPGFASCSVYETSASRSLEQVASARTGACGFPPESVTTLVFER